MSTSVQLRLNCTGDVFKVDTYVGYLNKFEMVNFGCVDNRFTLKGNSRAGVVLVCPSGTCTAFITADKAPTSSAFSSLGINIAALFLGLTALAVGI